MVAVVASLLLPHIQEFCTPHVMMHLALASLGFLWMCRDISTILESTLKAGLNLAMDKVVLDDVLKAIYDPITGLYACCMGTYVGASSMYGLGMDETQRTELVQASLFLKDEKQAHDVLLEPGGCKRLFPPEVQNWLQPSETQKAEGKMDVVDCSDKSTCDDSDTIDAQETFLSEESSSETEESSPSSCHDGLDEDSIPRSSKAKNEKTTQGDNHTEWMADPVTVFFKILQGMARAKLKSCAKGLPQSKIENVGIAAAVAFGIQLALRRSTKKSLITKLCAGVATVSLGTILSREALLGNVYDRQTLQTFGKELAVRILKRIKEKSASYKSVLAMLVLIISSKRKHVSSRGAFREDFVQQ